MRSTGATNFYTVTKPVIITIANWVSRFCPRSPSLFFVVLVWTTCAQQFCVRNELECHDLVRSRDESVSNNAMIRFLKKFWVFKITNFGPFCFNHNYRNGVRHNEKMTAVSASLLLFAGCRQNLDPPSGPLSGSLNFFCENIQKYK